MKIPTLLLGLLLPFLAACATPTPRPVGAVDWPRIEQHLGDLLAPRQVPGPIKNRSQARTGDDLWTLSLLQELTLDASEGDKQRALVYVHGLAVEAAKAELPPCRWMMKVRRQPCNPGVAP